MAIFPSGARVAFEMQCSRIQGAIWKERHLLYQKAGIKDFWILGNSVHNYGKTEGQEDPFKHQFISLASAIYNEENYILFLDTNTETIKGLYFLDQEFWHSDTIAVIKEQTFTLMRLYCTKSSSQPNSIKKDTNDG
jgi:competence protein CoiA